MPNLDPVQKFNQYRAQPKCKGKSAEQICQMMIAENFINHQEYQILKSNTLIFPFGTLNRQEQGGNWTNSLGMNLSSHEQTRRLDRKDNLVIQRQYHSQVKFIEIRPDKKADMTQFTLEGLKQRYDKDKYNIVQEKNGNIFVTTKDGMPMFSVLKSPIGNNITAISYQGNKTEQVNINAKGELGFYTVRETRNGTTVTTQYNPGVTHPRAIYVDYPNGDKKNTGYSTNGTIEFEEYWKKDGGMADSGKEYSNGLVWKQFKTVNGERVIEYPLVNELVKDLTAVGAIGQPTTRARLKSDVLNGINKKNIEAIWDEYEKQTGKTIIDTLRNKYTIDSKVKAQCINHIEKLFCQECSDKEKVGKFLAERLYQDIHGTNHSELTNHVKLLDKNNLKYVMTEYRLESMQRNFNEKDEYNDTVQTLRKYLPGPLCSLATDHLVKKATPFRGLLEAIDSSNISAAKKKELIKYITDTAMEDKNEYAVRNAKRDIASHPRDMHKVEVDLYRVQNAQGGDMRNPNIGRTGNDKTTREFIGTTRKQGQVGDCWLIAGLNSIIAKPEMLAKLNKLVSYDDKTGNYTVTMKGAKKKYVVSSKEIAQAEHLSTGSLKMKAVEIAMDRHIKEQAYSDKDLSAWVDPDFGFVNNVDINGGFSNSIWRALWGVNTDIEFEHPDIAKEDFNNPNRIYAFSLNGRENIYGMAKSKKNPSCEIVARHAYSIIGSDSKNVYVLNPWDSDDVITISRDDFAKMGVYIAQYEIPTA